MSSSEMDTLNFSDSMHVFDVMLDREPEDYIEMFGLSIIVIIGLVLNTAVFIRLLKQPKTPTASTSFLTGPYQRSSFTLFKKHLCLTDFAIILCHALGKIIWIYTLYWEIGGFYGCKIYNFLSAFSYYSNSNVVVAIGLDRLKVVYSSHIQGAASIRRVKWMLAFAWTLATLCAIPQLYVWKTAQLTDGVQCSTMWEIANALNQTSPILDMTLVVYEMSHQAMVFFIPFLTLLSSYLLIVVRVLHHTFHPIHGENYGKNTNAKISTANISEQRLLSNSMNAIPEEYCRYSYEPSTEMASLEESESSFNIKKKNSMVVDYFVKAKKSWEFLLGENSFGEKAIGKRKTACCGTVRSCCLTAETAQVNFRPLGIRPKELKELSGSPVWRRQLRSRIFITSLAIVTTHFILWLPYNLLNTAKFMHPDPDSLVNMPGINLLEDLIVLNSVLNPILYAYEHK